MRSWGGAAGRAVAAVVVLWSLVGSVARAESVEFSSRLESWVVPAEASVSTRVVVRVRDAMTKAPVPGLLVGAGARLPEGRVAVARNPGLWSPEVQTPTDASGEAVFLYHYEPGTAPASLPLQEEVRVFCSDFSYEDRLLVAVGMELVVKQASAVVADAVYPLEPIPLLIELQDAWHPNFGLTAHPSIVTSASVVVTVRSPEEGKVALLASPLQDVAGDLFDRLEGGAGSSGRMDLVKGSPLRLVEAGGSLLMTPSGLPTLLARTPGTFRLDLSLAGLRGDAVPNAAPTEFVIPVRAPRPSPFDSVILALASIIPPSVRGAGTSLFAYSDAGDFISFGRELDAWLGGIAAAATGPGSPCRAPAPTVEALLLAHVVANAVEDFVAMAEADRAAFLDVARVPVGVRTGDLPAMDWLDGLVCGILRANPGRLLLLAQKRTGAPALGAEARVHVDGVTYGPVRRRVLPGEATDAILETDHCLVLSCPSGAVSSLRARVDPSVARVVCYSIEGDSLVIQKIPVAVTVPAMAEFKPGTAGKGEVRFVDQASGAVLSSIVAEVAASSFRAPRVVAVSVPPAATLTTAPARLSVTVEDGGLPLDPVATTITMAGGRVAIPEPVGGVFHIPVSDRLRGPVAYAVRLADKVGHLARSCGYFTVLPPPPPPRPPASWTLASRAQGTSSRPLPTERPSTPTPSVPPPVTRPPATTAVRPTPAVRPTVQPQPSPEPGDRDLYAYSAPTPTPVPVAPTLPPPPSTVAPPPTLVAPVVVTPVTVVSPAPAASSAVSFRSLVVCQDIQDGKPVGAGEAFLEGVDRIHCWYRFENTSAADVEIRVAWYFFFQEQWKPVFEAPRLLPSGTGAAFSVLSRAGGKALPAGRYQVELTVAGEVEDVAQFSIAPR